MEKLIGKTGLGILFFLLFLKFDAQAQVTIGSLEDPSAAALLELKDQPADENNVTAVRGGFLLPRVQLMHKDELNPFIVTASDEEKKLHTGLIVYNLTENSENGLEVGLNYWDGAKWNLMGVGTPKASYAIANCEAITITGGDLSTGTPLSTANTMVITLSVTTPGIYNIIARTSPDNGYYFYASGEFQLEGTYEIVAQGAGSPIAARDPDNSNLPAEQQVMDELTVYLNGESSGCTKEIKVLDTNSYPHYQLIQNTVKVHGTYRLNKPVTGDEKITLDIMVEADAQGEVWQIYTNTVDGLSFSGTGVLGAVGRYTVTLHATGTPANLSAKNMTISCNSDLAPPAIVTLYDIMVQPVIGKKTIVAFGDTRYGLTSGGTSGCHAMITQIMNYGNDVNSIVKYEGFSGNVQVVTGLSNEDVAKYTGATGSTPYDIIVITYNLRPNATQNRYLKDYVDKGGVLIYLDQEVGCVGLINEICGSNLTVYNAVSMGAQIYQLNKILNVDDAIANGPFGDVRGLAWGCDFANTIGLTVLPSNDVIVYSNNINGATGTAPGSGTAANVKTTLFRHPTKNFLWCGDSGLIHGGTDVSAVITPFWVGSVNKTINGQTVNYPKYPVLKPNYGSNASNLRPVYNSTLFANIMAWALEMAETNGINTP